MRRSVVALAVLALALPAIPGFAAAADSPMKVCSEQWQAMKKAGTAKGTYKDFSKTCLSKGGSTTTTTTTTTAAPAPKAMMAKKPAAAPAPAPAAATTTTTASTSTTKTTKAKSGAPTVKASDTDPTGATAQCKDGTYSHSKTHSGSCAGHKGVAKFLT